MTTPMPMPMLLPKQLGHSDRRRRRLISVPTIMMVFVAPISLVVVLLPKTSICWTPPIIVTRKATSIPKTSGLYAIANGDDDTDDVRHFDKRSFRPTYSLTAITALSSTKSATERQNDSDQGSNVKENDIDTSNLEMSCKSRNNDTLIVETGQEREAQDPILAIFEAEDPSNVLPSTTPTSSAIHEIAIVLNTNAKGVTEDLIEVAKDLVAEEQQRQEQKSETINNSDRPRVRLLVTSTFEEARLASADIVAATANVTAQSSTTLVIPVGGDGTLTAMINLLLEEQKAALNYKSSRGSTGFPFVFGYVAMGTGNALGSVVGCLPVARESSKRHPKRKKILRLARKCFRPRKTKGEDFRRVLSQLIEAAAQTHTSTDEYMESNESGEVSKYGNAIGGEGLVRSNPLEVDTLELPLIRVRTSKGDSKHEILPNNGSSNGVAKENSNSKHDRYAFFAGLGYDSLLLQDYKDLQDWTESNSHKGELQRRALPLWQVATTGVAGYTVAMITRSLPKLLKLNDASVLLKDVKIIANDPKSAFWIDHRRGDVMRPCASDTNNIIEAESDPEELLLYRGSAGIIAAGTVPYYGGGLRLFPFARMTPGGMHLRISRRLHPLTGISRIPWVFEGSFRDKRQDSFRCLDFVGDRFTIEIYESSVIHREDGDALFGNHETKEGFPVQHSGESIGRCTRVEFAVSSSKAFEGANNDMPPPVRFLTLMPPRIVEEISDKDKDM